MLIKKAIPAEADSIAPLILLAMEDIVYRFIGQKSPEQATRFLADLIREEGNQYSYENCWVVISGEEIVCAAMVYNGGRLGDLRAPVARKVKAMFDRDLDAEDETQAGEYYIDSIGVRRDQQGKGVGAKVFRFLIDEYVKRRKGVLGLLVDEDNPNARRLYLKLGFESVGRKAFMGKRMEHLQLRTI